MSIRVRFPSFDGFSDPHDYADACKAELVKLGYSGFVIDHLPDPLEFEGPGDWVKEVGKSLKIKAVFVP